MNIKYGKLIIIGLPTPLIVLAGWSYKASTQESQKSLPKDHRIVAAPFLEDEESDITPRKSEKKPKRLKVVQKPVSEESRPDNEDGGENKRPNPISRPKVKPKPDLSPR